MKIINLNTTFGNAYSPVTLVISDFDGMHKGHQRLLQEANSLCEEDGTIVAVPLPIDKKEKVITPELTRNKLLQQYGVSKLFQLSKEQVISIKDLLTLTINNLTVERIIIDENSSIDNQQLTKSRDFINFTQEKQIEVISLPPLQINQQRLTTKLIKQLLASGQVEQAQALLGRPYVVIGHVIHGEKLGRKLGFPTINLGEIQAYVIPKPGVYFGLVGIQQDEYTLEYWNVLISAGYRPTVAGKDYLIEAHLLGFTGDLYDKQVNLSFLHFMREEENFSDLDALIKQMELDKRNGERLANLVTHPKNE
ncbi:bifunctional riboflavin kinase/FMN adenylyltransferase [Paraliobacillus ryukyuensis]|uniref:Riboflavin biosynthesis protein n=1 Tax=Paraliobacillus ryukyuensis TaxID=200904 RepID=A0A366E8D3_9BACI|nr:riboflavin kinase [Paraliobacillus ryukyuensis]RBO98345.1 riboflavin kinase/FMN adenylyltransferase [Paraliobacillus ryukyuensis]